MFFYILTKVRLTKGVTLGVDTRTGGGYRGNERRVAMDRRRSEIRCVFYSPKDSYSRRGYRHCWRDSLFRTSERGISQLRWPRALGPGPWSTRAWISDGGFLALAPRVVAFDTHRAVFRAVARKTPDNYLEVRPSCDQTRRDAMQFSSLARLGYWDFVGVKCVHRALCTLSDDSDNLLERDNVARRVGENYARSRSRFSKRQPRLITRVYDLFFTIISGKH